MDSVVSFQGPRWPQQSIPAGCICAYTWNFIPPYLGLVRNSPVLSCPADHESG